ncbi:MAG: SH3 domain-containing protein [Acidimicrobiia bacterium]
MTISAQRGLYAFLATVLLGACSPATGGDTTSIPGQGTATVAPSTTSPQETTTTTATATSTSTPATTTTPTPELNGEPVEGGPPRGAILSIVGVAHDDALNLRAGPGTDQTILAGIPPTYDSVLALGSTRSLPGWWTNVEYEGKTGWVSLTFLAYAGQTSDITSWVLDKAGGSLQAATMTDLGAAVADVMATTDPPSRVTLVVPESIGDLGEVTYDVIGIGDDSIRGFRLHVFGTPTSSGFVLESVESTDFCDPNRGVSDDGICV